MNTILHMYAFFSIIIFIFVNFFYNFSLSNDNEYQLWLRNDLYTNKHTQWYYFRVQNTKPSIKYKFTIMNLLKVSKMINFPNTNSACCAIFYCLLILCEDAKNTVKSFPDFSLILLATSKKKKKKQKKTKTKQNKNKNVIIVLQWRYVGGRLDESRIILLWL